MTVVWEERVEFSLTVKIPEEAKAQAGGNLEVE